MPNVENPTPFSSSSPYDWTYDVFISFRGVDTRSGFTGYLYKALHSKGINTFIDDRVLGKGEEITPALIKAIQESRIALVIFSNNYASSNFCLEELTNIMECSKDKGMMVWPVFYQVDPSVVRHQKGNYAEALAKHEARFEKEKIEKWRAALKKAADLSGLHFKLDTDRYEYEFIENIVEEVSKKINRSPLYVADYPVGLESRVQAVKSLLDVESNIGVRMVGIYGIDGIGKTTLSCAVYNSVARHFESLCFLDDIRSSLLKNGLGQLQETLLYELAGEKAVLMGNVKKGISQIRTKLCQKKVLLILDGVDNLEELRALTGGHDSRLNWFGSGSRIIITTSKKDLLCDFGVEHESTYEVEPLNHKEAREFFSWNAFKRKEVNPIYLNISDRVINYCKGLPLSLEKMSSDLFGKTVWECNSTLEIQKIPYIRDKDKVISKRKEKAEAHSYSIIIKVALDADLYEQIGKDIFFDLVDLDKVRSFCIGKQTPFIHFKEEIAEEFGIPVMYHRFWLFVKCQNHTYRPNRPLTPQEETQSVGQLIEVSNKAYNAELKLFLELEIGEDFRPIPPPEKSKEDLLLFFKLYDPKHKKLRYIGRFYVKSSGKPKDILTRLNEMAGFAPNEEIELFKETKLDPRDMCDRVSKDSTFHANELEDGDIICYQKTFEVGRRELFPYPDVCSFLEYVYNRQMDEIVDVENQCESHCRFAVAPLQLQTSNPSAQHPVPYTSDALQGLIDAVHAVLNKRKEDDESHAELTRSDIIKCIQSERVRFRGVNLSGLDLSKLDLSCVDFSYACLKNVSFSAANLKCAKFRDVDAEAAIFHNANLHECEFIRANLRGASLAGACLQCANMQDAYLVGCSFIQADLRSACLQCADFTNANLEGAILEGANLKCAKLKNANLKDANLRRAYMRNANLQDTRLEGAKLDGANLLGAIR